MRRGQTGQEIKNVVDPAVSGLYPVRRLEDRIIKMKVKFELHISGIYR